MVLRGSFVAAASVLLLGVGTSAQVVFDAADVSGAFQDPNGADLRLPTDSNAALTLTRPDLPKRGNLVRLCDCSSDQPEISDIRGLSDKWLAGGTAPTSYGFTNLVWSWGQFIGAQRVLLLPARSRGGQVCLRVHAHPAVRRSMHA